MRYRALACDYDGTLATHGQVGPATIAALERFVRSGRRLLLVTGRQLEELLPLFPEVTLFDRVVAENGALLYTPASKQEQVLSEPFAEAFVPVLTSRGVHPVASGRVIVATWEPHEVTVLQTIRDLGLELQVIFNKGAVMVLPSGVNKATGLVAALRELGLSPRNTVGVGDAENDHAFLAICECGVAVANALPVLKERADVTTAAGHGEGVAELIEGMLKNDLADLAPRLARHDLLVGRRVNGEEFRVPAYGHSLLLACPPTNELPDSAAALLHRLNEAGYQYCLIQSASPTPGTEHGVVLGTEVRAPTGDEVVQSLSDPTRQVVVVLAAIPATARRQFVLLLLSRLRQLRAETSRPHWIVLNQPDQFLAPRAEQVDGSEEVLPQQGLLLISANPGVTAEGFPLVSIALAAGVGVGAWDALRGPADGGQPLPLPLPSDDEWVVWKRNGSESPFVIRPELAVVRS